MSVMGVGRMRMGVREWRVVVQVRMRFGRRRPAVVRMIMVIVADMHVIVVDLLVLVPVSVALGEEKKQARNDERSRGRHLGARPFSEYRYLEKRTHERRAGEKGRLTSCSDQPHRVDGENEAQAIRRETETECLSDHPEGGRWITSNRH